MATIMRQGISILICCLLSLFLIAGCSSLDELTEGDDEAADDTADDDADDDDANDTDDDTGEDDEDDDAPAGSQALSFDCQIENYEDGWGEAGEDTMTIDTITGPEGATVEEPVPGEYVATGEYQLTTFPQAEIEIVFSGTAQITDDSPQVVDEGTGSFEVRSTLVEVIDGSGRLVLTMAGDDGDESFSNWMFDVLPALGDSCD